VQWLQAQPWARRFPAAPGIPYLYLSLTILCLMTAYAIVTGPATLVLASLAGGFFLLIWLLAPESAVYALVLLYPFGLTYNVGELRNLRPHDALLLALGVTVVCSLLAGNRRIERLRTPFGRFLMTTWIFLLVWGTVSYLMGPANQWLLKDPIRNSWYAYRQVWRMLLPFPLLALCIRDRVMTRQILDLTILTATACALYALARSMMSGHRAEGHFGSKNELAAFLVVVIPLAIAQAMLASDWHRRLTFGCAALILMRVLLLTQSRGGYAAFFASCLPLALLIPRRRLVAAATAAVIALGLFAILRGNLLERPNIQRILALQNPTEIHTMQWREEQWAYFMDRLKERPMLGTGSGADKTLLASGRLGTAHNAYLSIAYSSGIPAAIAWILLLTVVAAVAWHRALLSVVPRDRAFWLGLLGMVAALVTHGMVDTVLDGLEAQQFVWSMMALALLESIWSGTPRPVSVAPQRSTP